jgi:hypothetical protein
MGSNSPEEKQIEEFLASLPPCLRKAVQGDLALTREEEIECLRTSNLAETYGQARDTYLKLLQGCPAKLREYREREAKNASKNALRDVPTLSEGAPRKTWLARAIRELHREGMSQREIAEELNKKYPNQADRKGNARPITAEVVRKQLAAHRRKTSPEIT